MTVPSGPIPSFTPGKGLQDGGALQKMALQRGTVDSLTAQADNTKANATPITACIARFSTVAGAADSALLPPGYPGLQVLVMNAGAQSMQVFGSGNDTINGIATATGIAQANGKTALYTCHDVVDGVGIWSQLLSA